LTEGLILVNLVTLYMLNVATDLHAGASMCTLAIAHAVLTTIIQTVEYFSHKVLSEVQTN